MAGKRLNTAGEADHKHLAADVWKLMVRGEPTRGRFPHGRGFVVYPTALQVVSYNREPDHGAHFDSGVASRSIVINFGPSIPEELRKHGKLVAKILSQPAVLFGWAIDGAQRLWRCKAYTEIHASTALTRAMQKEADPVAIFVDEFITEDASSKFTVKDAWVRFENWAQQRYGWRSQADIPREPSKFGRRLADALGRKPEHGNKGSFYRGLALKSGLETIRALGGMMDRWGWRCAR